MFCEICGEKKAVSRANVDGTTFALCENCNRFGKTIEKKRVVETRQWIEGEDILPNYAEKIRKSREKKKLSMKELAGELLEKRSVLERVEQGKMLPDKKLVKKLEKFFGISIRGVIGEVRLEKERAHETTLGDLASVKVVHKKR